MTSLIRRSVFRGVLTVDAAIGVGAIGRSGRLWRADSLLYKGSYE